MSKKNNGPDVNLNLNVRGLSVSATLAIQELSNQLKQEGRPITRLGLGQSPFPVPREVVEALKTNAHQKAYLPVKGLMPLREAVAEYHRRRHQIGCVGDDILIGPGSKELMFLLQIVYYGDLLIPSPSWVSYAPQAQIIGRQVHWVPTKPGNNWQLLPGDLETICSNDPDRPRIVVLNYPNNPTGCTYTAEKLKAIAKVAKKYRIIVLSDEIYGELHHLGRHVSMARFYPQGTIISSGLSKWCGAGGWRLGTFTFPRSLRWLSDAMAVVASETFTSTSAPIQYAAVRAFQGGIEIERYLSHSRRILRTLGRRIVNQLGAAGISVVSPQGAFYIFPDFSPLRERFAQRDIHTSVDLCRRLLEETGIAALPGSSFGRPDEELTVRMAYVDFDGARSLAAAEQVPAAEKLDDEFLEYHCARVTSAVERLCEWIQS